MTKCSRIFPELVLRDSPRDIVSVHHKHNPQREGSMATSVDAKLLKSTKFPVEFNQKVDMQKVNVEVMKK